MNASYFQANIICALRLSKRYTVIMRLPINLFKTPPNHQKDFLTNKQVLGQNSHFCLLWVTSGILKTFIKNAQARIFWSKISCPLVKKNHWQNPSCVKVLQKFLNQLSFVQCKSFLLKQLLTHFIKITKDLFFTH